MRAKLIQALEARPIVQLSELSQTGCHSEWISAERAGLIDGTDGCKVVHHFCPPTKGTDRQAAADDFPKTT
jgi:hypothetical protein